MKTIKSALIVISASALSIGFALADPASATPAPTNMPPVGHMNRHMAFDPVVMAQKHLARLKSTLKITPDQETVWQGFADKVNAQAKNMADIRANMRQSTSGTPMTAPERMSQMADSMKTRAQGMADVADAAKTLYDKLSPDQRSAFDTMAAHEAKMHRNMPGHPMPHAPMNNAPVTVPGNAATAQ